MESHFVNYFQHSNFSPYGIVDRESECAPPSPLTLLQSRGRRSVTHFCVHASSSSLSAPEEVMGILTAGLIQWGIPGHTASFPPFKKVMGVFP